MKNHESTRNVLVAVDVQNDFINGSLAVPKGKQVVAPLNEMAQAVREDGGDVVFTRDWHPATTPHFDNWPVHCVQNTHGARFDPRLKVKRRDTIISKGMGQTDGYSGMDTLGTISTGKTLERIVRPSTRREHVRVFIGGLATDYCVKATALDLASRFEDDERVSLFLLRDAVRAVNLERGDEKRALKALSDADVVAISTAEARQQFFDTEGFSL